MVILAAAALILMSAFGALVLWQLYRLGREMQAEMQPILISMQDTTDTVRGTAEFVSQRMSEKFSGLVALAYSARTFYHLVQQFVRGLRQMTTAPGEVPASALMPPDGATTAGLPSTGSPSPSTASGPAAPAGPATAGQPRA